jgi:hypothetical protein
MCTLVGRRTRPNDWTNTVMEQTGRRPRIPNEIRVRPLGLFEKIVSISDVLQRALEPINTGRLLGGNRVGIPSSLCHTGPRESPQPAPCPSSKLLGFGLVRPPNVWTIPPHKRFGLVHRTNACAPVTNAQWLTHRHGQHEAYQDCRARRRHRERHFFWARHDRSVCEYSCMGYVLDIFGW